MITQAQITAESMSPALTDAQIKVLTMLVRRYPAYARYPGLYPLLAEKLAAEKATPTIDTQALKAVLTQLDALPSLVVESSGSADAQSFFSTNQNWAELAQDVLDVFYDVSLLILPQSYGVVQRNTEKMAIRDRVLLHRGETGRRW